MIQIYMPARFVALRQWAMADHPMHSEGAHGMMGDAKIPINSTFIGIFVVQIFRQITYHINNFQKMDNCSKTSCSSSVTRFPMISFSFFTLSFTGFARKITR